MVKRITKVYLEELELKNLEDKARDLGFIGRGWLSHYLSKMASQPVIILDKNLRTALEALKLK
jgi:hypothetical protein